VDAFIDMENPVITILDTMGHSMGHISHMYELVPLEYDFMWGESYFRGASTIIPNLFWSGPHPGSEFLGSDWYKATLVSQRALEKNRGPGFNFFAEAYLNFGILGIIGVPMLFGYGLARLNGWGERGDPAKLAMIATFGAFILQIPRGYLGSVARPLVWYALMPYLCKVILKAWGKSSSQVLPVRKR
jgi:hypothetical protein